jgi:hypothetical protein
MSTWWRCAVCEAVNDGGETCAACGAKVTRTVVEPVVEPTPAEAPPAPERAQGDDVATEIPVRELPRRQPERVQPDDGPYDVFDLFDVVPAADADAAYDSYERVDTRPRVRVYGCCLPIALGILLALLGAVALLGSLLVGVL